MALAVVAHIHDAGYLGGLIGFVASLAWLSLSFIRRAAAFVAENSLE